MFVQENAVKLIKKATRAGGNDFDSRVSETFGEGKSFGADRVMNTGSGLKSIMKLKTPQARLNSIA